MTVKTFSKILLTIIAVLSLLGGVGFATQAISAANTMQNFFGWIFLPIMFYVMYRVLKGLWKMSVPLEKFYQCTCEECLPAVKETKTEESKENAQ